MTNVVESYRHYDRYAAMSEGSDDHLLFDGGSNGAGLIDIRKIALAGASPFVSGDAITAHAPATTRWLLIPHAARWLTSQSSVYKTIPMRDRYEQRRGLRINGAAAAALTNAGLSALLSAYLQKRRQQ